MNVIFACAEKPRRSHSLVYRMCSLQNVFSIECVPYIYLPVLKSRAGPPPRAWVLSSRWPKFVSRCSARTGRHSPDTKEKKKKEKEQRKKMCLPVQPEVGGIHLTHQKKRKKNNNKEKKRCFPVQLGDIYLTQKKKRKDKKNKEKKVSRCSARTWEVFT